MTYRPNFQDQQVFPVILYNISDIQLHYMLPMSEFVANK